MLEGDNDTSTVEDLSNFEADVCGGVNAANELTAEGTDISISAETRRHNFFAIIVSLLLCDARLWNFSTNTAALQIDMRGTHSQVTKKTADNSYIHTIIRQRIWY